MAERGRKVSCRDLPPFLPSFLSLVGCRRATLPTSFPHSFTPTDDRRPRKWRKGEEERGHYGKHKTRQFPERLHGRGGCHATELRDRRTSTMSTTDMRKVPMVGCVNSPPRSEATRTRDHATYPPSFISRLYTGSSRLSSYAHGRPWPFYSLRKTRIASREPVCRSSSIRKSPEMESGMTLTSAVPTCDRMSLEWCRAASPCTSSPSS